MIRYACLNLWTTVLLSAYVGREATCIDLDCEGSVRFCKVWTLRAASAGVVPAAKRLSPPCGTYLRRRKVRSFARMKAARARLRITCSKCTFTKNRSSVENIFKNKSVFRNQRENTSTCRDVGSHSALGVPRRTVDVLLDSV